MQPDLLGGGSGAPAAIHRLFFALIPDEAVAKQIETVATGVAASQLLRARMVRRSRYHATLHFLGDHHELRQDIVRAAISAGGKVQASPFDLVLDTATAFHGREPPCVLRSSEEPAALQTLWQDLRQALVLAGLGSHISRSFAPHVTFAYSRGGLPPSTRVEPVAWRVEGFALLHSVVGAGEYQLLDAWRFQSR
ncbi:RNA 2',3'-cyclic phosphodiesterase [Dyella solisilvae]|uniref:RNA 2',3'-cyclic phosphodiesterase n=2 Tax=Dyella solisilvae TaxID=1920168 RepID=A0A370KB56_9GAMM|nr:RNA 2',3'-cyclic phosphodiesterase [Dyella solisilvae]